MIYKFATNQYFSFYHKNKDKKIIFVNGVFDIFHLQHLRLINYAKNEFPNHKLVIGVNSDKSVKNMNKNHPLIFDEIYRSEFLQELVDDVIIYDDFYDYLKIIKHLNPSFVVKGPEYKDIDIPEKEISNVIYFTNKKELSSTQVYNNIIRKFKESTEI